MAVTVARDVCIPIERAQLRDCNQLRRAECITVTRHRNKSQSILAHCFQHYSRAHSPIRDPHLTLAPSPLPFRPSPYTISSILLRAKCARIQASHLHPVLRKGESRGNNLDTICPEKKCSLYCPSLRTLATWKREQRGNLWRQPS